MAGIILPMLAQTIHTYGLPAGFVNPEGSIEAKMCSRDKVLEKLLQNTKLGCISCSEMSDHVTCFTVHGKYEVTQGSLLSRET